MNSKKPPKLLNLHLDKIVGGGQAIGTLENGKKMLVWGGLPSEDVEVQLTKKRSKYNEGFVTSVLNPSPDRVEPRDQSSYLSTSPWQIMKLESEQHYKAALIEEAFELHNIVLPDPIDVYTDNQIYGYRNKIEFSWWWDNDTNQLDLAFFRRGTKGKIPVDGTSLAMPTINKAGLALRDMLRERGTEARSLKTALIRSSQDGKVIAQLYVTVEDFTSLSDKELESLGIAGFELIYSNPKSPASVITKRLQAWGEASLTDTVQGVNFRYATEGFFQINIPVYEQALQDISDYILPNKPVVDLYSGVGSIGLTVGGQNVTLIEINEHAVREMERNIKELGRESNAKAILSASESALEYINRESMIIVDPPRAGLHDAVIEKLLNESPERIIYLSCNPTTQARDVAKLAQNYGIKAHRGYNFFPRTPHIEHLVVLDKLS